MQVLCPRPQEHAAIRTDLNAIFVSLELSRSTWVITSLSPGGGEKMSKHSVRSGDVAGLLEQFARLRAEGAGPDGEDFPGHRHSRGWPGGLLDRIGAVENLNGSCEIYRMQQASGQQEA